MVRKQRVSDPNCEGRFIELRNRAIVVARESRYREEDPLWAIITQADLEDFVQRMASQSGENEEYNPHTVKQLLGLRDMTDPYMDSRVDSLRGDPLVGRVENIATAMTPFVFEGVRESLIETTDQAKAYIAQVKEGDLDDLEVDLFVFTGQEYDLGSDQGRTDAIVALGKIAKRDTSITANSMDPGLLYRFGELYVTDQQVADKLRLFHRGTEKLDKELGINMERIVVDNMKGGCSDLSGYSLQAEFGPGSNVARNLVSSYPYRLELQKTGSSGSESVFGVGFFLKHPNTIILSQIQDIRGARVPPKTSVGICALTIMERVGRTMGFDRIETYDHRTNPVHNLYPDDLELTRVLKMNFDDAAEHLGWERNYDGSNCRISFSKQLSKSRRGR